MNQKSDKKEKSGQSLKALREEREESIQRSRQLVKRQNQEVGLIKKELKKGPLTVPELAQATGLDAPRVLWYVSSLKKFGQVDEGEKEGGYFRYLLVKSSAREDSPTDQD